MRFGRAALLAAWMMTAAGVAVGGGAAAVEPPPVATLAAGHPLAGKAWRPADGRFLTPDEVVALALAADVVVLGETHDNPDHHALQAWVTRRIVAGRRRPAAAFEMVDSDQQPLLDAIRGGDINGLGETLGWEKRGWPAWAMYRPIAEAVLAAGGGLAAANLPADLTRRIAKGQETPDIAARFGLDDALPARDEAILAGEIRAGHCHMLPESAVAPMVRVQRARDAAMAEAVAAQAARPHLGPAILIAGSGHARTDHGVPARLKRVAPATRPLALAFLEVAADDAADPAAMGELPYDVVWFTGRVDRDDPCEQMRRHMEKKDGAR